MQPLLRTVSQHWTDIAAGRPMPARRDVDATTLPPASPPHLFLVEVLSKPVGQAFRYRLVGTAVVELAGRDATGRLIDPNLYGPFTEAVLEPLRACVAHGRPVLGHARTAWRRHSARTQLLYLPLGEGGRVSHVLGAVLRKSTEDPGSAAETAGAREFRYEVL